MRWLRVRARARAREAERQPKVVCVFCKGASGWAAIADTDVCQPCVMQLTGDIAAVIDSRVAWT